MEPSDIDKIIKGKLQETNDAHNQEMDSAKPFVWSAITKELKKKKSLSWYHLAAAVLLLLLSFSFIFYSIQQNHENEMVLISDKIDQLQKNYQSQLELLNSKDAEVKLLANELRGVELQLSDLGQFKPISQKEIIVYRTDTVYVKQVEYITSVSDPVISIEKTMDFEVEKSEQLAQAETQHNEIDAVIYPSFVSQGKKQKSETIKVKFLRASRN